MWTHQSGPRQYTTYHVEFTKWEKIDVKGPLTLSELKDHFEKTYSIDVSMITYGSATVYTSFDKGAAARLPLKVPAAI